MSADKYMLQGKYNGEWSNLGSHDSWQSVQQGMLNIQNYRRKFNMPELEMRIITY